MRPNGRHPTSRDVGCYTFTVLQPVDVLVCLKLILSKGNHVSFENLEREIFVGSSSIHRAVERASDAGLITGGKKVNRAALLEFLLHGVRYAFYVKPGELTRGLPTAHAAPPLDHLITPSSDVPVWPDPEGITRGYAVTPLHKEATKAAKRDPELYKLLALVDALRIGRARERKLAQDELTRRLKA